MLDLIRLLLSDTPAAAARVTDEKVYQRLCDDFRALNAIFWQIPLIVMTLNGGLWAAAASLGLTPLGQSYILYFAALVNVGFMAALLRLRLILQGLLGRMREMEADDRPTALFPWLVIAVFWIILGSAAVAAIFVARHPSQFIKAKADAPCSSSVPRVAESVAR